jgi:hypothetical protein
MLYSSPSLSPSGATMASLPATPLNGLGLSNCYFWPETMEDSLAASPYMSWLDSPCSQATQIGHDQRCLSNQYYCLLSGPPAINLTSTQPISRSFVPVQGPWTVAAAPSTSACSLQYHFPTALGSFSLRPYQTASSLQCQTRSYETRSSSTADASYSWCGLKTQEGCQTPKLSSSYSTPLRPVSPMMPHAIFAASAPESPTFATNLQCESGYIGGNLAEDLMQSQHQTQTSRAFSWPPDCSNLEQLQEMDALVNIQRSQRNLPNPKQSYRSSHKAVRGGNGGSHRTHGRVRVTCSFGDKCNQTDLERHINTVRQTQ